MLHVLRGTQRTAKSTGASPRCVSQAPTLDMHASDVFLKRHASRQR